MYIDENKHENLFAKIIKYNFFNLNIRNFIIYFNKQI